MPSPTEIPRTRKRLASDCLLRHVLRPRFLQLPDARKRNGEYTVADAELSALAMFSLKDPSLLAFQNRRTDQNMKNLYRIQNVPSDSQMRDILDPLEPDLLRPLFQDVFRELQRGKALEPFVFYQGSYLLSLDGTEYFSSQKVHCPCCLSRTHKNGTVTYYHQMLGAGMVHPDHQQVIPFAPEAIVQQDGQTKNDCERNASKRLLEKIRREHPLLNLTIVEDGLASNSPHIRLLKELKFHFILGAKPDDHLHLFAEVERAEREGRLTTLRWTEAGTGTRSATTCELRFVNDLPLNQSNDDLRVHFLQYTEYDTEGRVLKRFRWVTDFTITGDNARHLMRGGRSRWKIENETFNTLKNQGYHFEHNYGHGQQHLSVVLAMLMMLAFLLDQTQALCDPLFQAVRAKFSSLRLVWDHVRSHFRHFEFVAMQQLYEVILLDSAQGLPAPRTINRYAMSTLRHAGHPNATQDSLPAVGQTLLDGLSTRRVPTKGFELLPYISSSFPKLCLAQSHRPKRLIGGRRNRPGGGGPLTGRTTSCNASYEHGNKWCATPRLLRAKERSQHSITQAARDTETGESFGSN